MIDIFSLEVENMVGSLKGQKILLYGDNDTGKTKQAMRMEKPLLLMCESGGNAVTGLKQPVNSWSDFLQIVNQLTSDRTRKKGMQKFQTIVVDTVDILVNQCEGAVCKEFGVRDLSEMNDVKDMPNGYLLARNDFKMQINRLTNYGYTVVFIAHSEIITEKYVDPNTGKVIENEMSIPFNTKNKKSSNQFVRDLCDFVFYVQANGIDKESGNPKLSTAYSKKTDFAFARSRYIHTKPIIDPFTAENMSNAILDAIKQEAEEGGVEVTDFVEKKEERHAKDYIAMIQPLFKTLYGHYPEKVQEIVAEQLGDGAKISEAKDTQCDELETIYNRLQGLATDKNIDVE